MRSARAADHWRRVTGRDRGFGLGEVRVSGKAPLDDVLVEMPPGIAIICGLNGVGKSTMLRLVEGLINGRDTIASRCRPDLLATGSAQLTIEVNHTDYQVDLDGAPPAEGAGSAVVIDAFESCARAVELGRQPNFDDLISVVEPRVWSAVERERAGYVVGRTYDAISVFEVENPTPLEEGFADDVLPYFQVSVLGVEYDSFAMGLGELAALTFLWRLWSVEPQSVVIVEEPETFLSSRATAALLDAVAAEVDGRRLYALVSTHSPDVVAKVPIAHVRLVRPIMGSPYVTVDVPQSHAQLEYALGALTGQARLVLVEDRVASVVVRELLGRFVGVWGDGVDVQAAGDVDRVTELCKLLPRSDRMRVLGVLDGDQAQPTLPDGSWPVLLLPGGDDPNRVLRSAAETRSDVFSETLHRDPAAVAGAAHSLAGVNAHDWFPDLARALQLEESTVIRAACECWLRDDAALAAAQDFAEQVAKQLAT